MSQQGRLQQTIAHYRQSLLNNEAEAERALNAAHLHTLAVIQPQLDKLYVEITAKLNAGETIPPSWIYERLRLEHLTLLIKKQVDQFGALSLQHTRLLQHQGAQLGQQSALAQLDATVPPGISWNFGLPDPKAIADLVGATQAGSPLADLFGGFGDEAADKVGKALVTGLSLGNNPRQVARDVQQALGISRNRALVLARTEQIRAYRSANLETYRANSDVVDMWIWSAQLSPRTCAACLAMNGTEHPLSEQMGSHPNCFPSGTIVSGPRVVGSTARWYEGEMVEIETIKGNFLSVTPNHPILTPDGWIAAGKLNEGSNIISRRFTERPFAPINPNDYQIEAPIEKVAMSFGGAFEMSSVSMPTASKDFHGDGIGSQVHIVRTCRHLRNAFNAPVPQPKMQQLLCWGHVSESFLPSLRSSFEAFNRLFSSCLGSIGGFGIMEMLFRGAVFHHQIVSSGVISQGYAHFFQAYADNIASDSERLSNGILRFPCHIPLYDFLHRKFPATQLSLGDLLITFLPPFRGFSFNSYLCSLCGISERDITLLQPLLELSLTDMILPGQSTQSLTGLIPTYSSVYPVGQRLRSAITGRTYSSSVVDDDTLQSADISMEGAGKLIHRLAGSVQSDQIIRIRKRAFSGHVYNLQTKEGWYIANNIITHNCRCVQMPKTKDWSEILGPLGIDTSNIPDTRPQVQSGSDWFDDQDEAVQKQILGPGKFAAYQNGDFTLDDIVGRSHDADWGGSIFEKPLKELVKA